MVADVNRIPDLAGVSTTDAIMRLTDGHPGAIQVLLTWCAIEPADGPLALVFVIDAKRLYGDAIWDVYELCGYDIHRFIYHVSMELPNQATGKLSVTGNPYMLDRDAHMALRRHGRPGSYWALQNPPTDPDYVYPIA